MALINKRNAQRKNLAPLEIGPMTSLTERKVLSRGGELIQASSSGFLLHIKRENLVSNELKRSLSLHEIVGHHIIIHISAMNIEIDGEVKRVQRIDKKTFAVAVDYSDSGPDYWRECLMDFLPMPEDFDVE